MVIDDRARPVRRDEGLMLVLTLVFTVVLSTVVLALSVYATVGLRAADTTTRLTEGNAAASSALNWAIEEFGTKHLVPDDDAHCRATPHPISTPANLLAPTDVDLTCTRLPDSDAGHPQVLLQARVTTAVGHTETADLVLEVPVVEYKTQVNIWHTR